MNDSQGPSNVKRRSKLPDLENGKRNQYSKYVETDEDDHKNRKRDTDLSPKGQLSEMLML